MKGRIVFMAVVAGCSIEPIPGQFGEEEDTLCEVASRTPAAAGDTVQLADSDGTYAVLVGDVLASIEGTFMEDLRWEETGEDSDVTLILADAIDVEVVDYVEVAGSNESEPPPAGTCPTRLEASLTALLSTGDGRLDESFVAIVSAVGDGSAYLEERIDGPSGTVDPTALAAPGVTVESDAIRVNVHLRDGAPLFSGAILPVPIGGVDEDARALATWPLE